MDAPNEQMITPKECGRSIKAVPQTINNHIINTTMNKTGSP